MQKRGGNRAAEGPSQAGSFEDLYANNKKNWGKKLQRTVVSTGIQEPEGAFPYSLNETLQSDTCRC